MALSVVALLVGEPAAADLWTLRQLAREPCDLHVIRARTARGVPRLRRARRLVRDYGLSAVASRLLATRLVGAREARRQRGQLDRLFDGESLRAWWAGREGESAAVPTLNHPESRAAIAALAPDLLVRVSGGILRRETLSLARLAALNIHHGLAPAIRGMWSIPWGLVEGRRDWIGATVHVIDDGIDTGAVLWRGAPQLAPGDTGATLFFRAHLEAVAALADIVAAAARGGDWCRPLAEGAEASSYRSAPGLRAWLAYLRLGRGSRARVTLESGVW